MAKADHREAEVAHSIEQQTAKIRSDVFLWSVLGSNASASKLQ
jgi:hypothetical protein